MKAQQSRRWFGFLGSSLVVAAFAGSAIAALPKTWGPGDTLTDGDLNNNFKNLDGRVTQLEGSQAPQVVYLKDVRLPGTNGGTFPSSTWGQRALNTIENPSGYTWVSLNGNQFTLAPGQYEILATVPSHWCNRAQARLRNVTDGTTTVVSASGLLSERTGIDGQATITSNSVIMGRFAVSGASKLFQIDSVVQMASGDDSTLGHKSDFGEKEVYTQVRLMRLSN